MKYIFVGIVLACGACSGGQGADGGGHYDVGWTPPDSTCCDTCNPLLQIGCNAGEKCNWVYDQLMPSVVGHIGCEPAGTAPVGTACGSTAVGPDPCVAGAECVDGECKQICDNQGGMPECDDNHACVQYQDLFVIGSNTVAGVCDPGCDPLTQDLKLGTNKAACGSPDPTKPVSGCYGYDEYSCGGVAPTVSNAMGLTLTDRVPPAGAYLNACAPGFMPILMSETGSMTGLCNGICAAVETYKNADNTITGHEEGSLTEEAKNPTDAAAAAANGQCLAGKRGSAMDGPETCRFLWIYNVDDAGMLKVTEYTDKLGVCFARNKYKYDSNGDGVLSSLDNNTPACNTLPKHVNGDTVKYNDSGDFFCATLANDMFKAPDHPLKKGDKVYVGEMGIEASSMRAMNPHDGPVPMMRHRFAN